MKPLIIAANWKSNKTTAEAMRWVQDFTEHMNGVPTQWLTIILCVPFTLLYAVKESLHETSVPIELGAENVSPFSEGPETGEESARMVKELADWVIIGHSERRKNFGETDVFRKKKVEQANTAGLKIIYCVPDENERIPENVSVVAYEPVFAIGSGSSEDPERANAVIERLKARSQVSRILYGGSVNAGNIVSMVAQPSIDGILSGSSSLDPIVFSDCIKAVVAA